MSGWSAVVGLAAWNVVVNRLLPARYYIAGNLAATALVVAAGRAAGATNRQLGLPPGDVCRGIGWGSAGAAAIAGGAIFAARVSVTRPLFDDARATSEDVVHQTLLRIPLGTVVLEEAAFRGVLPALLEGPDRDRVSLRAAGLFGLWHVLPTLNALDINGVTDRRIRAGAVVAGVAATTLVALGLDSLRLRSGGVLAPALTHWSANSVSYLIAARNPL